MRRQGKDAHRARLALDRDEVELNQAGVVEPRRGVLADDQIDAVLLGEPLEPRRQVHRIAEQRIIEALVRAEIAYAALPGVDADADMQGEPAFGRPGLVEL